MKRDNVKFNSPLRLKSPIENSKSIWFVNEPPSEPAKGIQSADYGTHFIKTRLVCKLVEREKTVRQSWNILGRLETAGRASTRQIVRFVPLWLGRFSPFRWLFSGLILSHTPVRQRRFKRGPDTLAQLGTLVRGL